MEINKSNIKEENRINYLDNIKGLLIFLVVLGHFLYDFSIHNTICSNLAKTIYLFHMPVFVFCSGFLCKDEVNYERIKKFIIFYLIGNTFFMLFSYMFYEKEPNLIEPYYSFWYLLALITWRIGSKYLKNIKCIMLISIIVSLLVGFSIKINNTFALSRIICFFPVFILGIKAKEKNIYEYISKNIKMFKVISLLLLIAITFLSVSIIPILSFNDLQMFPYINKNGIIYRIIIYLIACIMILIFLSLMPNKKNIITNLGRNSLYIYLYHRVFSLIISKYWIFGNNTILTILISIICSIIICAIFGSEKIRIVTENAYEIIIRQSTKDTKK